MCSPVGVTVLGGGNISDYSVYASINLLLLSQTSAGAH